MSSPYKDLHQKLSPEEYDLIYDSVSEAKERRKGINPMSKEHQEKVNLQL